MIYRNRISSYGRVIAAMVQLLINWSLWLVFFLIACQLRTVIIIIFTIAIAEYNVISTIEIFKKANRLHVIYTKKPVNSYIKID